MTALKWLKMKIRELQSKEENQWHGWVQWSKKTFGSNLNEMNSTQFWASHSGKLNILKLNEMDQ